MDPTIPLPPPLLRVLVGPTEDRFFDNPTGAPALPGLPPSAWESVLDFGCGCGRLARQMMQQQLRPGSYLGVDLHAGMVEWCRRNLSLRRPEFRFVHHDVYNKGLNPAATADFAPFPVADGSVSLLVAWSVFTHLLEAQAERYLREVARVLRPGGFAVATWFLFEKDDFPMLQDSQNALYVNPVDPSNAVVFDRTWLLRQLRDVGLVATTVVPPAVRGYQWILHLQPRAPGLVEAPFPRDEAPVERLPPPLMPADAPRLGLDP